MSKQEHSVRNREEVNKETVPHLKPSIFWILLIVSSITLIIGLFTLFTIIFDTIKYRQINYPDALMLSIFLIFGGLVLLRGTFIMRNWAPPPQIETLDESSDIKE